MTVNVNFQPKPEYLYVKLDGQFEVRSMVSAQENIMDACAQHQARKVLVDFRKLTGNILPQERFQFAEAGSKRYIALLTEGKLQGCRFAYLGKPPQLDPDRYGETVAVNRGVIVKATDNIREAFEWIGVQQDMQDE